MSTINLFITCVTIVICVIVISICIYFDSKNTCGGYYDLERRITRLEEKVKK